MGKWHILQNQLINCCLSLDQMNIYKVFNKEGNLSFVIVCAFFEHEVFHQSSIFPQCLSCGVTLNANQSYPYAKKCIQQSMLCYTNG